MTKPPTLSVIIPVFNGAQTLAAALDSVLTQRGGAIEIIVVDDGSTDGSAAVARTIAPAAICLSQENQGPAAARNRGLAVARGDFISFLDADDLWPPGRVEEHLQLFVQAPEVELVIGTTRMSHLQPPAGGAPQPMPTPMVLHQLGSITCRRQVFDRIGNFDPALFQGEDSDWFGRALRMGVTIHMTRAVAVEYRIREGSLTYATQNHLRWYMAALRADLQARRRGQGADPADQRVEE